MSVFIFLAVLFVLVLVHELGHFVVAKWTGMRVDEFGIGFPPRLFGKQWGETLYSLNLFPIGGFVKIFGEDATDAASSPVSNGMGDRRSEAGEGGVDALIKQKKNTAGAPSGSFTSKNKWAQSAVLLAGITMNILFAWLIVAIAFGLGVKTSVPEADATPSAALTITQVLPGGPASDVSLKAGAVIKGVTAGEDTLQELKPSAFSTFIDSHTDTPITVVYVQDGEPRVSILEAKTGIIKENPEQHAIGVALAQIDTVQRSFSASIRDSFVYTITGLRDITLGIGSLLYDAVRSKADFSQIAGPVGIVGLVGEASSFGVTALLMFTAFISLNLAVINVLPFPALDGGRLLFVIIEAVKGSPIAPRYVATLNTVGFLLLILLMIAVTWNDIAKLM